MANEFQTLQQMYRINALLEDLPDGFIGPIRDAVNTQAALVASEIKGNAPVDEASATPGALKDSITTEELPPKGTKFIRVVIKAGGKTTTKEVKRGKSGFAYDYDFARAQEFGTVHEPAHPFFFPIWRARRKDARAAIRAAIQQAAKGLFK